MNLEVIRQKIIVRERRVRLLAVALIIAFSMTVLLVIPGMLSAFLIAFVITFIFKPIVNFLERRGLNRTVSVLLPFLISMGLAIALSSAFLPKLSEQMVTLQTEIPVYMANVTEMTKKSSTKLNNAVSQYYKINVFDEATAFLQRSSNQLMANVPNLLSTTLSTLILAPFFAFFMLKDGRSFIHQLLAVVPNNLFELSLNLQFQINQQLGGFVRARILESALVGMIVWLGLLLLGFPYALFLAIFAGITNIIPYIGPLIGAAPAIVIALGNQKSGFVIAVLAAIYVVAQVLDMLLVIPLVVAKIVDLHPVTVVLAIIVGGQIMGILGMIISIPVASILKLTFTEFYHHVVDFRG